MGKNYQEAYEELKNSIEKIDEMLREEDKKDEREGRDKFKLYNRLLQEARKKRTYPLLDKLMEDKTRDAKRVKGVLEILLEITEKNEYNHYYEVWADALLSAVCTLFTRKKIKEEVV